MWYTLCMPYTIEAQGLTKAFGATRVLDGLDLEIQAGEVFALLGPNGAGKTTTVRILSTLLTPDGGHRPRRRPRRGQRPQRRARRDQPDRPGGRGGRRPDRRREPADDGPAARASRTPSGSRDELLERFDLADAADRRVATYSGGMRRRLDLAMSLVSKPEVIFLDEPSTGLDPRSRRAVWEAVQALADEGATILLTTQYLEEADRLADRIAVVNEGRIAAQGTARSSSARGEETLELRLRRSRRPRPRARRARRRPHRRPQPARAAPAARTTSAARSTPSTASRSPASNCTSPPSTRSSWP